MAWATMSGYRSELETRADSMIFGEGFLRRGVLDDAVPGLDHVEGVDGDVVGPRDDLRPQDVQARDAKRAGKLVE